jgi:DNA-binding NtrC family response regulator
MLIVDDEESIRFAMSEYFKVHGYQVDCAQSVEEATALLGTGPYSVVIADLRLTGLGNMGGMEVIRSVRERHPKTPIIVLSAYRSPEIEAEIERHRVGAFVRKPKPLPDVAQIVFGMVGAEYHSHAGSNAA